jgi:hypothetical protein
LLEQITERFRLSRKFFDGRDFMLVLALLLAVFFCYLLTARRAEDGQRVKYAEIRVDGRVDALVALNEDREYTPGGLPAVRIAVRNGAVGFIASDCPDKICVHTGFLSLPGQAAVCLPNRVVVQVAAAREKSGENEKSEEEVLDTTVY